jgi:hypothetical protein
MIRQGTLTTVHLGGLKSTRVLTTDLLAFLKIDPSPEGVVGRRPQTL